MLFLVGLNMPHQILQGQTNKIQISCTELDKLINPKNGKSPLYRFNLDSTIYFVDPEIYLPTAELKDGITEK